MPSRHAVLRAGFLAVLVCVVALPAAAQNALDGRWVLADSTYERGRQNLAPSLEAHGLEIVTGPGGTVVRAWTGDASAGVHPWPAVLVDGRPVDAVVVDRGVDRVAGRLHATLRIPARRPGDLTLEIEESYALSGDGDALVGTVDVRMWRDGEPRGGYALTRRYARVR